MVFSYKISTGNMEIFVTKRKFYDLSMIWNAFKMFYFCFHGNHGHYLNFHCYQFKIWHLFMKSVIWKSLWPKENFMILAWYEMHLKCFYFCFHSNHSHNFGGHTFQQIIGILIGTNCTPLLVDLFLYSYEAKCMQTLIKNTKMYRSLSI